MSILCRLSIHAKIRADEHMLSDLYHCRRCPARWHMGTYAYSWGVVPYRERIADATAAKPPAEGGNSKGVIDV